MSMLYLFAMPHGNSATKVIVEEPEIKDGVVRAVKVGTFGGWNHNGEEMYDACEKMQFIAGGGCWTLTEFRQELRKRD